LQPAGPVAAGRRLDQWLRLVVVKGAGFGVGALGEIAGAVFVVSAAVAEKFF